MTKDEIKQLALANGFKLKEQADGTIDLNPYVYDFAMELLNKDKWVSVEDRLPEKDMRVMVYAQNFYMGFASFKENEFRFSTVSHWQALPKPPKQHNNKLWAVNIPEELDSPELLFAVESLDHAQSIVSRLHNEIFETYPTLGEPIADAIYVAEWQESAEEHAESLATKWWEHTTFLWSE